MRTGNEKGVQITNKKMGGKGIQVVMITVLLLALRLFVEKVGKLRQRVH